MNDDALELTRLSPEDLVAVAQRFIGRNDDPAAEVIASALRLVAERRRYTPWQRFSRTLAADFGLVARAFGALIQGAAANIQVAARRAA